MPAKFPCLRDLQTSQETAIGKFSRTWELVKTEFCHSSFRQTVDVVSGSFSDQLPVGHGHYRFGRHTAHHAGHGVGSELPAISSQPVAAVSDCHVRDVGGE